MGLSPYMQYFGIGSTKKYAQQRDAHPAGSKKPITVAKK